MTPRAKYNENVPVRMRSPFPLWRRRTAWRKAGEDLDCEGNEERDTERQGGQDGCCDEHGCGLWCAKVLLVARGEDAGFAEKPLASVIG